MKKFITTLFALLILFLFACCVDKTKELERIARERIPVLAQEIAENQKLDGTVTLKSERLLLANDSICLYAVDVEVERNWVKYPNNVYYFILRVKNPKNKEEVRMFESMAYRDDKNFSTLKSMLNPDMTERNQWLADMAYLLCEEYMASFGFQEVK